MKYPRVIARVLFLGAEKVNSRLCCRHFVQSLPSLAVDEFVQDTSIFRPGSKYEAPLTLAKSKNVPKDIVLVNRDPLPFLNVVKLNCHFWLLCDKRCNCLIIPICRLFLKSQPRTSDPFITKLRVKFLPSLG